MTTIERETILRSDICDNDITDMALDAAAANRFA
jgi:hypothetical protein